MSKQWFRFTIPSGTIYGEVTVPTSPPQWFEPQLATLNSSPTARRTLSMGDFSPSDWLDILCSANRPIPLSKPLSPRQRDELLFFAEGKFEEMKKTIDEVAKTQPEKMALLNDDNFIKKFGMFMEDFNRVDPARRGQFHAVPRKNVQPMKARVVVDYIPMIDTESNLEDQDSYVLYPHLIGARVAMNDDPNWQKMADEAYGATIAIADQMPRVLKG